MNSETKLLHLKFFILSLRGLISLAQLILPGRLFGTADANQMLNAFSMKCPSKRLELRALALSSDGNSLAGANSDGQSSLWGVAADQARMMLSNLLANLVSGMVFFNSGSNNLASVRDNSYRLWRTASADVHEALADSILVTNLALSPDGKTSAAMGRDANITLWDSHSGFTAQVLAGGLVILDVSSLELVRASTPRISTRSAAVTLFNIIGWVLTWLIPAAQAAIPTPPGGPILVVTATCPTCGVFNQYYAEILRTEGFNEFDLADISTVTSAMLAAHDVVILASTPLTSEQANLFTHWVEDGGSLIASRPDPQLASLLGLTATGSTLSNAYLLVDTSRAPGNGIVSQTMQFHGVADRYSLSGASSLATLYSNASTATPNPALTLRSVGAKGGQAAAFTYDIATSIVYTRQGNPAWQAQERDGHSPVRSDDMFYGNAVGDTQPWVDLNTLVAVPQADEQQRLLGNLITQMNLAKKPLPRFWYFPRGEKAVVIMTGDDHGNGGTGPRFDQFTAMSPTGCNVADWECVRGTSYIFVEPDKLSNAQAAAYTAAGFEVGLHVNTKCEDWTPSVLESFYVQQVANFQTNYPSIPAPITQRHHCIVWSDWSAAAQTELNHGIRLDTSYYFWPSSWVNNRPGNFTGSAMPMRFADLGGNLIDVYQVVTQMTDESGQTYPYTIDTLLDHALGPAGYYGAYTINAHTDQPTIHEATATVNSALARSVPVVSGAQMLTWLDGRNGSSFGNLAWKSNTLTFTVTPAPGANGLQAMVPTHAATGDLVGISGPQGATTYTIDTVKGIEYAFFSATAGRYTVTYMADTTPPAPVSTSPAGTSTGISPGAAVTATLSKAMEPSTINDATVNLVGPDSTAVPATVTYDATTKSVKLLPNRSLSASTTYTVTIKGGVNGAKDLSGFSLNADYAWSFTTAAAPDCPCSALNGSATPANPTFNGQSPIELGVKFTVDIEGFITGIRFFKATGDIGKHVGNLWTEGGQLLATANFSSETETGWQQVTFSRPVPVKSNAVYVASYFSANGRYAVDSGYFVNAGVDNYPVHLLKDGVSGSNGVYGYNASSAFPTSSYLSNNYWVDVVFSTSAATPLSITTPVQPNGKVGLAYSAKLAASGGTRLYNWSITSGALPPGLSLNATTGVISGTPAAAGTFNFTAQVSDSTKPTWAFSKASVKNWWRWLRGRTSDIPAGMASQALSITVAAVPTSIWPNTTVPGTADSGPDRPAELGVKFKSDVSGYISGIRFYKASANIGTHVGNLWSSSGTLLASATFTSETESGWQQVNFAKPAEIAANTVYVASYHTNVGHYSNDKNYFATTVEKVDNPPLHVFFNGLFGGDSVFAYGANSAFPSLSGDGSNYWVDVVFTPS